MSNVQALKSRASDVVERDFIRAIVQTHSFAWIGMSAFATYFILILIYWSSADTRFPVGQAYMKFAPRWFSGFKWATSARDIMRKAHGAVCGLVLCPNPSLSTDMMNLTVQRPWIPHYAK